MSDFVRSAVESTLIRGVVVACMGALAACGGSASSELDGGSIVDAQLLFDAGAPLDADAGRDAGSRRDAGADPTLVYSGPLLLSETGLYADIATRTLAEGVMPYRVR